MPSTRTRLESGTSLGFEFLGFHIRRYPHGKLLIKPSPKSVKRVKRRLADEMRCLRGSNVSAVLARLIPIVRGWAAYYRSVVSSRVFSSLDHYLWQLVYKWVSWTHANKPKSWVVARYFGKFNKFRNDRWVFGDRDSGAYLPKFYPQARARIAVEPARGTRRPRSARRRLVDSRVVGPSLQRTFAQVRLLA